MMIDTDKIKDTADWIESKTKTKSGWYILFIILIIAFSGFIIWLIYGQYQDEKTEKLKYQERDAMSAEREARIKEECAETMKTYFAMFKEFQELTSGNISAVKSIEWQTNQAIKQQDDIIKKVKNDETD